MKTWITVEIKKEIFLSIKWGQLLANRVSNLDAVFIIILCRVLSCLHQILIDSKFSKDSSTILNITIQLSIAEIRAVSGFGGFFSQTSNASNLDSCVF